MFQFCLSRICSDLRARDRMRVRVKKKIAWDYYTDWCRPQTICNLLSAMRSNDHVFYYLFAIFFYLPFSEVNRLLWLSFLSNKDVKNFVILVIETYLKWQNKNNKTWQMYVFVLALCGVSVVAVFFLSRCR